MNIGIGKKKERIAIGLFNGFGFRYLYQTDFLKRCLSNDAEVLVFVDESVTPGLDIAADYRGLKIQPVRTEELQEYSKKWGVLQQFFRQVRLFVYGDVNVTGEIFFQRFLDDLKQARKKASALGYVFNRMRQLSVTITKWFLSRSHSLRSAFVWIECRLFTPSVFSRLLIENGIDEVVVVSLGTFDWDQYLMREANKLGIDVSTVILSWDNPTTRGYRGAKVNRAIVWTRTMKNELCRLHDIPSHNIFIGGVAIFDNHFQIATSRRTRSPAYARGRKRKIFFATKSPNTYPWNPNVIRAIGVAIKDTTIADAQLIARIHPLHYRQVNNQYVFSEVLESYKSLSEEFRDEIQIEYPVILPGKANYMMPKSEIMRLTEGIADSDVVVNIFSTLNIESAIFDKPLVNICYDHRHAEYSFVPKARHSVHSDAKESHNQRIVDTGGVRCVYNDIQLVEAINSYLENPELERRNRQRIVDEEAGPYQGYASRIVADFVCFG